MPDLSAIDHACHSCGSHQLEIAREYPALHRVTSDCKPWPPGGFLARCLECGLVQTLTTPQWQAEADQIYRSYAIYHQGGGAEQMVFVEGRAVSRSEVIVQYLLRHHTLPSAGRSLDIGCGNGAFLRACSKQLTGWRLNGSEFDTRHRAAVEAIPQVEKFYPCALDGIPGEFDLISTIHVLEHIAAPKNLRAEIRRKLKPGGLLLIEVPDCLLNPYILLVADHCTHFAPSILAELVSEAGFEVLSSGNSCVPKENTLMARKADSAPPPSRASVEEDGARIMANESVLTAIVRKAAPLAQQPNFGIFGSSIAATWLNGQLGEAARFFVDEDPNRAGSSLMGKPIFTPAQVSMDATVFVALPATVAKSVCQRLEGAGRNLKLVTLE